jgi:hypothetical protein
VQECHPRAGGGGDQRNQRLKNLSAEADKLFFDFLTKSICSVMVSIIIFWELIKIESLEGAG